MRYAFNVLNMIEKKKSFKNLDDKHELTWKQELKTKVKNLIEIKD